MLQLRFDDPSGGLAILTHRSRPATERQIVKNIADLGRDPYEDGTQDCGQGNPMSIRGPGGEKENDRCQSARSGIRFHFGPSIKVTEVERWIP